MKAIASNLKVVTAECELAVLNVKIQDLINSLPPSSTVVDIVINTPSFSGSSFIRGGGELQVIVIEQPTLVAFKASLDAFYLAYPGYYVFPFNVFFDGTNYCAVLTKSISGISSETQRNFVTIVYTIGRDRYENARY